jgi:hypothetical protein
MSDGSDVADCIAEPASSGDPYILACFEPFGTDLTADQVLAIDRIADRIADSVGTVLPMDRVLIVGHSSRFRDPLKEEAEEARERDESARERAENVKAELVARLLRRGVDPDAIQMPVFSMSDRSGRPGISSETEEGRNLNRRVEVFLGGTPFGPVPEPPPPRPSEPEPKKERPFPARTSDLGKWFDEPRFLMKGVQFHAGAALDEGFLRWMARLIRAFEQVDTELHDEDLRRARQRVLDLRGDRRRIERLPHGPERKRRLAKLESQTEAARKERQRVTRERGFRGGSVEWAMQAFVTEAGLAVSPPLPGPPSTLDGAFVMHVFGARDIAAVVDEEARQIAEVHSHPSGFGPASELPSRPDRKGAGERKERPGGFHSFLLTPSGKLKEYNGDGVVRVLSRIPKPTREQSDFARRFLGDHREALLEFQRRQDRKHDLK